LLYIPQFQFSLKQFEIVRFIKDTNTNKHINGGFAQK
jgi:hypothetical protein